MSAGSDAVSAAPTGRDKQTSCRVSEAALVLRDLV
jgi:hypothetical protein